MSSQRMSSQGSVFPCMMDAMRSNPTLAAGLLLLLMVAVSCSNLLGGEPERLYLYRAASDDEVPLLFGRLTLEVAANDEITGEWQIDWIDGIDPGENVGSQLGRGVLRGALVEGYFRLDLNPDQENDHVVLVGFWGDGDLIGTWGYGGVSGIIVQGTFRLDRVRTPH